MVTVIEYGPGAITCNLDKVETVAEGRELSAKTQEDALKKEEQFQQESSYTNNARLALLPLKLPNAVENALSRAIKNGVFWETHSWRYKSVYTLAPDVTISLNDWIEYINQCPDKELIVTGFGARSVEKLRSAIACYLS